VATRNSVSHLAGGGRRPRPSSLCSMKCL
jgi:hypothetical protein